MLLTLGGAKYKEVYMYFAHLMLGGSGGMLPQEHYLDPLRSLLVQFQVITLHYL